MATILIKNGRVWDGARFVCSDILTTADMIAKIEPNICEKADIAVLDDADEGFSLTDAAGNHLESKTGYRCVLTIADGQIVYKH